MKILIILVALLILTGCSSNNDLYSTLTEKTTELVECNLKLQGYMHNATGCVFPEQQECPECISSDYLSLEEYQTMSTRIKWLEKRLEQINSSERTQELEDNYTMIYDRYVACNNSLNSIKELLE